jgi:MFS family permease
MEGQSTKLLLALLFVGTLMGALDLAIIGPALPVIQAEFGMQQRELAGLINSYTMLQMLGALLLAKLADRLGPKKIYIASVALFAAGSLVIVIAETAWMLYLGRALQGFGAGGFFPAAAAVIGARLAPRDRGQALGILGMVWGVAFLAGPILGGIFLRFSWHWLFTINLPIAAVLIFGAVKLLPAGGQHEPKPFDKKGMFLLMLALGSLILAVNGIDTKAPLESMMSLPVAGGSLMLITLVAIFWQVEKRAIDPIVRPSLFASSQIAKCVAITTGTSAVQTGSIFIPALLVLALDVAPADSALLLLPGVVAATIMAPVFGKMINRTGTRFILVLGQSLVLIGLLIYAFTDLTLITYLCASIISGVGSAGLIGAPLRYIVLAESGNQDRAASQGLLSVGSSTGRLLGASVVGAVAASQGGGTIGYQAAFSGLVVLAVLIALTAMTLKSKDDEKHDTAEPAAP